MNRRTWMPIVAAIAMAAGAIAIAGGNLRAAQEPAQTLEVSAKKYEFAPSEIHVKKGTNVRLKITATDRDHGFEVDPFAQGSDKKGEPGLKFSVQKPEFKLPKNEAQIIEFSALQAGTYEFKCSVFCGTGHRGMKGQIIVDP
ncbi:MAG TPA: cupredoxin domain-containing protein [Candidatus Acidoferrales bacterium]|nr:cupredoxin domain-containing protein [Candidatus Acidoferrales bacterium]